MNFTGPFVGTAAALAVSALVESSLPVTVYMQAEGATIRGSTYTAEVTGYKVKGCRFVAGSYVGWYMDAHTWIETPFEFIADATPDSTRPHGLTKQSFGVWAWSDLPQAAKSVRLTLQHDCDGRLEFTEIGPFQVGDATHGWKE